MRPVFVQAEYVDGVPDLGTLVVKGPGPDYYVMWETGTARHDYTFRELPNQIDGATWFFGSGSANIVGALASAGVRGARVEINPATPRRQRFIAAGAREIRVVDTGEHVGFAPPVVFAGHNPISVGLDGRDVEGEEYYVPAPVMAMRVATAPTLSSADRTRLIGYAVMGTAAAAAGLSWLLGIV